MLFITNIESSKNYNFHGVEFEFSRSKALIEHLGQREGYKTEFLLSPGSFPRRCVVQTIYLCQLSFLPWSRFSQLHGQVQRRMEVQKFWNTNNNSVQVAWPQFWSSSNGILEGKVKGCQTNAETEVSNYQETHSFLSAMYYSLDQL